MELTKYIFVDRDGTLIEEPFDQQVDRIEKIKLKANVIPGLRLLQQAGYKLVMVSNQDGLGSASFPRQEFNIVQDFLLSIFESQQIYFDSILICPHFVDDNCACRKPLPGLVMPYLTSGKLDFAGSYMIGDRLSDVQLAKNIGVTGILFNNNDDWLILAEEIITKPRETAIFRQTKETTVLVKLLIDRPSLVKIQTGISFFDHMLEQLAKHAGVGLILEAKGDLIVDDHHTIEDVAITLGQAFNQALGDKLGVARYGFLLPMDDALVSMALDLCGRSYFKLIGRFSRMEIGGVATEMFTHFFRSFSDSLNANLHIKVTGENNHHMIEAIFKALGRVLRQAVKKLDLSIPSTKGVL